MSSTEPKETKTKQLILEYIKKNGPSSSVEISSSLNLTPMAIRKHLYELVAEKNICSDVQKKSSVGRPAKFYKLTRQGQDLFPNTYEQFSTEVLSAIKDLYGSYGLNDLLEHLYKKRRDKYKDSTQNMEDFTQKLKQLKAMLDEDGFMAELVENSDGSVTLSANHCPIFEVAKGNTKVCNEEHQCYQSLFGDDVKVNKTSSIMRGEGSCSYCFVPQKKV